MSLFKQNEYSYRVEFFNRIKFFERGYKNFFEYITLFEKKDFY